MKKVLIVVDMLNDFCDEKGVLSHTPNKVVGIKNGNPVMAPGDLYAAGIIGPVRQLVEMHRNQTIPIIWLADNHPKDDLEFKRWKAHAVAGTWGARIIDELRPPYITSPFEVENSTFEMLLYKTRYNGFFDTTLGYQLTRLSPDTVEVCGVCTSICVMDTVGGLANRDYNIRVDSSCVADFDPAAHEAALARMAGLYGAQII